MNNRPVLCILDDDQERCLRAESALEAAIMTKKLPASGISMYEPGYLARTGLDSFPAIELNGAYFIPKTPGQELDYDDLCDFLDMLVRRGVISSSADGGGATRGAPRSGGRNGLIMQRYAKTMENPELCGVF